MTQNKWWRLWRGQGNIGWLEGKKWQPFFLSGQQPFTARPPQPLAWKLPLSLPLLSLFLSPSQICYARVNSRQQNSSENWQKSPPWLRTRPPQGATVQRTGSRVTAWHLGVLGLVRWTPSPQRLQHEGQDFKRGWGLCELSVLAVWPGAPWKAQSRYALKK